MNVFLLNTTILWFYPLTTVEVKTRTIFDIFTKITRNKK